MNLQAPFDRKATEKAWQYYIHDRHALPAQIDGVRPFIVDSWRRSLNSSRISRSRPLKLSEAKLQSLLQENALLMQIAYPYLLHFYQWIDNSHLQITLADKNGFQIGRIDSHDLTASASSDSAGSSFQAFQLDNGTDFSEAAAGTNGIGTSLAMQQPVMIFGAEHFQSRYHDLACYASPLYDPAGSLLGSINITGPLEDWDPLILCVLKTAVSGIEKEFELTRKNELLDTLVESCGQGVIMLDAREHILYCNQDAAQLLHAPHGRLTGQPIDRLIRTDRLPEALRHFARPLTDEDCTLYSADGQPVEVNLTIRTAGQDPHGLHSILILLRSQKDVHLLTTKLAGFTAQGSFESFVGNSHGLQMVTAMGKLAAERSVSVLLLGEKGTGKHMLAQAIHNEGPQPEMPFVELNCASTPTPLMSSELFGNEDEETGLKIPGRIQLADGGTLYLDEIGALPEPLQKRLVQVLQDADNPEKSVSRFRLIASSSANLLSLIRKGAFREDLYYRLNALTITIPPLRERKEDIPVLAEYFSRQMTGHPVRLEAEASAALEAYSWPGNTRELEETIRLSIHSAAQESLAITDLPVQISSFYYTTLMLQEQSAGSAADRQSDAAPDSGTDTSASDAMAYYQLSQALKQADGNVQKAADILNMPRSSLYRRLRRLHIRPKDYRRKL